jgi:hypothetical protein
MQSLDDIAPIAAKAHGIVRQFFHCFYNTLQTVAGNPVKGT